MTPIINITHENLDTLDLDHLLVVAFAEPGAMGPGGVIELVSDDGAWYLDPYRYGGPTMGELAMHSTDLRRLILTTEEELFPYYSSYSMGFGHWLFVRNDVDARFSCIAEDVLEDPDWEYEYYPIYQNWRLITTKLLESM